MELCFHSNTPRWHGAQLKHRDIFTFTFTFSGTRNVTSKTAINMQYLLCPLQGSCIFHVEVQFLDVYMYKELLFYVLTIYLLGHYFNVNGMLRHIDSGYRLEAIGVHSPVVRNDIMMILARIIKPEHTG
jgi:hypothetical protein